MKLLIVLLLQSLISGNPRIAIVTEEGEYEKGQVNDYIKFTDDNGEALEICAFTLDQSVSAELQGAYDFMSSNFFKLKKQTKIKLPKGSKVNLVGDVNKKIDSTTAEVTFLTEVKLEDGIYTVSLEDMPPDPVSYLCLAATGAVDAQTKAKTFSIEVSQVDRNGNTLPNSIEDGSHGLVDVSNSSVDLKEDKGFSIVVNGQQTVRYALSKEKGFRTCLPRNGLGKAKVQKSDTEFTIQFLPLII